MSEEELENEVKKHLTALSSDILRAERLRAEETVNPFELPNQINEGLSAYSKERETLLKTFRASVSDLVKDLKAATTKASNEYQALVRLYQEGKIPLIPGRKIKSQDTLFAIYRKEIRDRYIALEKDFWKEVSEEYAKASQKAVSIGRIKTKAVYPPAMRPLAEDVEKIGGKAIDQYFNKEVLYLRQKYNSHASSNLRKMFTTKFVEDVVSLRTAFIEGIDIFARTADRFGNTVLAFSEIPTIVAAKMANKDADTVALMWVGPDDGESCENCRAYTNQTFLDEDLTPDGPFPRPQMWLNNEYGLRCGDFCRCQLVPVEESARDNKLVGRSFTSRFMPVDENFTLSRLQALTGIRFNDAAYRLFGKVAQAGVKEGREILESIPGLRQWGYFSNVDSIQVLPREEITNILKRIHRNKLVSDFGYPVPNRGRAILVPKEFSQLDQIRLLVREIGTAIVSNSYDKMSAIYYSELFNMMGQVRTAAAKKLEDVLSKDALKKFVATGVVSEANRDLVAKLLGRSPDFYTNVNTFFTDNFADLVLNPTTFIKKTYAKSFRELLAYTTWSAEPLQKYLRTRDNISSLIKGNLSNKEANVIYRDIIANTPKKYVRENELLMKEILNIPAFRRREYWFDSKGNTLLRTILPSPRTGFRMKYPVVHNSNAFFYAGRLNSTLKGVERGISDIVGILRKDPKWDKIFNDVDYAVIKEFIDKNIVANMDEALNALKQETTIGKDIAEAVNAARNGAVGNIIAADSVGSFAHEFGHLVWFEKLTPAERAEFFMVYKIDVAASKKRVETALAVLGDKLSTTGVDKIKAGMRTLDEILDYDFMSATKTPATWNPALLEMHGTLWKNGMSVSQLLRAHSLSDPQEWFADMFRHYTLHPHTLKRLNPHISEKYIELHHRILLGESLAGNVFDTDIDEFSKVIFNTTGVNDLVQSLDKLQTLDIATQAERYGDMIERILKGEFGKITPEVRSALERLLKKL